MERFDARRSVGSIAPMSDEIIDITRYFERDPVEEVLPRTIAMWGADGERSRFALPLWRVVHLAGGERGMILWRKEPDGVWRVAMEHIG